jgi:hypothetical protein
MPDLAAGRWVRRGNDIVVLLPGDRIADGRVLAEAGGPPFQPPTDVIDARIDVGAQRALLRMFKADVAARIDATGMLTAVKSGQLAGIFGDDLLASVKLAGRLNTQRWLLVPKGEDATLVVDPAGPPAIVFRGDTPDIRSIPSRIDSALRRAWASFEGLRGRRCFFGLPTTVGSVAAEREGSGYEVGSGTAVEPRLSLFENAPNRPLSKTQLDAFKAFKGCAERLARRIRAFGFPTNYPLRVNCGLRCSCEVGQIGPAPYETGADIIRSLACVEQCLNRPVEELHIFGHSGPNGIFGTSPQLQCGLYHRQEAPSTTCCGRTVGDIPPASLARNVTILLHGCNTAKRWGSGGSNSSFAHDLAERLVSAGLSDARVFGHPASVAIGVNDLWVEFSDAHPTGKKVPGRLPGPSHFCL